MFIYIYIPICFLPDVPLLLPAGLCTLQQLASFYPVSTLAGPPMELLPASAVALCFAYFHHSPVAGSREVYIYIYVCVVENAIPGTLQMQHDETGSMGAMSQTHTHTLDMLGTRARQSGKSSWSSAEAIGTAASFCQGPRERSNMLEGWHSKQCLQGTLEGK